MEQEGNPTVSNPAVPKFASFKRKDALKHDEQPPPRPQPNESTADEAASNRRRHKHRSLPNHDPNESRRDGDPLHRQRRHESKGTASKEQFDLALSGSKLRETPSLNAEKSSSLYLVDVNGDRHNVIYGTIHRYSVPPFYRVGAGNVLGLGTELKIDRFVSQENKVIISDRSGQHSLRSREKYAFARNENKGVKKLRIRPELVGEHSKETIHDYVPLRDSRGTKRKRGENLRSSSDEERGHNDRHYRSIEGKAKATSTPMDDDLQYVSESSASDYEKVSFDSVDASSRQRGIELSRRVKQEPADVDAWLELISHQDVLLEQRKGSDARKATNAERRSTADIKLSLYEEALAQVILPESARETLLLKYMREGSKVWESKKQSEKWRKMLHENAAYNALWREYLQFEQTNFVTFGYEAVRNAFADCIQILRSQYKGQMDAGLKDDLDDIVTHAILQLTCFMRDAGFTENAFAIWQGLLEVNFFMPERFTAKKAVSNEGWLPSFEDFWESEVPRVGEQAAEGWKAYDSGGPGLNPPGPQSKRVDDEHIVDVDSWAAAEALRGTQAKRVGRSTDEEDEDPFRVVFYSDIKAFLVCVTSEIGRRRLLNAFLTFNHLPPVMDEAEVAGVQEMWTSPFVRTEPLDHGAAYADRVLDTSASDMDQSLTADIPLDHSNTKKDASPFYPCLQNFAISTVEKSPLNGKWVNLVDPLTEPDVNNPELQRVRRALRSLVAVESSGTVLAEYYIAYEMAMYPMSAKKTARNFLKKRLSSLRLYNAYALIEWRCGNKDAATKVFSTALDMNNSLDEESRSDTILLWRTWIWELLQDGDNLGAWRTLVSIPNNSITEDILCSTSEHPPNKFNASPAILLKARRVSIPSPISRHIPIPMSTPLTAYQTLEAGISAPLIHPHLRNIPHYTDLLSLFNYFSSSFALDPALIPYTTTLARLSPTQPTHLHTLELLHQSRARLLYHHVSSTNHPFRPALLRSLLLDSLTAFPNNTIFLSLHAWLENRFFRLDDRLRATLRDVVLREGHDTVVGWVFAIGAEARSGRGVHAVRAVFERAVAPESTARSAPAIWSLYIHFCLRHRRAINASDTAAVFYRALRACPWAKPLYMLAFTHLRGTVLGPQEMRGVFRVMGEKELRIFIDAEEVLGKEGWMMRGGEE
ncbi:MAG: Protein nrde2 [Piccolia ochrophora]|nr:MAG: Protein nrde2 [Piccolia ochrophora]